MPQISAPDEKCLPIFHVIFPILWVLLLLCGPFTHADDAIQHIVLTPGQSIAPDAEVSGPIELETQSFILRFSAEAKPVSIKSLPEQQELLNTARLNEGFYLECVSGRIYFSKLLRRGDGRLVFKTANETQQIVVSVAELDRYLTFRLDEFIGIPAASPFTLHFGMEPDASVRVIGLDYMTTAQRALPVRWYWIWHRHPQDPLGGFALYRALSEDDEDETLLHIWANEGLPHPRIDEPWDLERARRWLKDWKDTFQDTSVLWCTVPKSEQELIDLLPHLKKADIREVHLMPWTWSSGRHHCEVNDRFFTAGREGFRNYVKLLADHGMRATIHYDFCGIPFNDPIFIGTKPDDGLSSWGVGELDLPIGESETTLSFRPASGTELPFMLEPFHYRVNPPALHCVSHFNFFRLGDEIIKVGAFKNTNAPVWILENCERGVGATNPASHSPGDRMTGLVAMFGSLFIPEANSGLFSRMTRELSDLVNECSLSHVEYDGVSPAYSANSQWMYRKFLGEAYSGFDHPVTLGTGYGEAPPFGYFEYEFNAVKRMQGHELGPRGDIGARIRTHHLSRPASTIDESHYRLSQVAAFNNRAFSLHFEMHYPAEWRNYGRFEEICTLIADWKAASRAMTEPQREQIRATLKPPNIRGYQSDTVWRLRREADQFKIFPSKNPLTRRHGDILWGVGGGEMGYVVPGLYGKPGESWELENPYAPQPPQFVIQVLTSVDPADPANIPLQPELAALKNPTETQVAAEGAALVFTAANPHATVLDNRPAASLYPSWERSLDLSRHRAIGMWLTGDNSGGVFVLRLPGNRDYAVPLNFMGRRYIEIPNGEAYWADAAWGGPMRSEAVRYDYKADWYKLGFGEIPAGATAQVSVEGLQALHESESELHNPVIQVNGGRLAVQGSIKSNHYLEYKGGATAVVYDPDWNRLAELPVAVDNYQMPTGWHTLSVTVEPQAPHPWLSIRFITEGEPMLVPAG